MAFIDIEKSVQKLNWNSGEMHSHSHYEIYYLIKGNRKFFISNSFYEITPPCLIIVPPHIPHRTSGNAFERYAINVMPNYLNKYQKEVLDSKAQKVLIPTEDDDKIIKSLLEQFDSTNLRLRNSASIINAIFSYFVFITSRQNSIPSNKTTATFHSQIPSCVLDVIEYFNDNYAKKLTLDEISQMFYISKNTLIYNFKKYNNCSPIEYLLLIRLSKAKQMLINTTKSITEISAETGFSSPNYFSLIFKKKEHTSPANFRKYYTKDAKPNNFDMI